MKKILFSFMTVVLLLSGFVSPAKAVNSPYGSTVIDSNGTVYLISREDNVQYQNAIVKRPYTSEGAFLSYSFNSWDKVKPASVEDLALPTGSFIPPRDGKVICSDRGADRGTCYLITDSQLAGFTSENAFYSMGYKFENSLTGDVSFLPKTSIISDATKPHSPGSVILIESTAYVVSYSNLILGIPSWDTLLSWGYTNEDIVAATPADKAQLRVAGIMPPRMAGQYSFLHTLIKDSTPEYAQFSVNYQEISFSFDSSINPVGYEGVYNVVVTNLSSTMSGQYSVRIPNIPSWIKLSNPPLNGGLLPSQSSSFHVTINASAADAGVYNLNMYIEGNIANSPIIVPIRGTVKKSGLQILTDYLPEATAGEVYSATLQVTGGTAPYSWSVIKSNYPTPCCVLGVTGYGTISTQTSPVIPDKTGTFYWLVEVTDAKGAKVQKNIYLKVRPPTSVLLPRINFLTESLPDGKVGQSYKTDLLFYYDTDGTVYPVNAFVTDMPPGLGPLTDNGIYTGQDYPESPGKYTLSGTPIMPGTYTLTLYLTDYPGYATTSKDYTVVINP